VMSFFDAVSHEWLMRFVEHRVGDLRIKRLVRNVAEGRVMEEGELVSTEAGTPHGAVATPRNALDRKGRSPLRICLNSTASLLDSTPLVLGAVLPQSRASTGSWNATRQ
jgi:hypothetical protein